jgi:hypothetical protein
MENIRASGMPIFTPEERAGIRTSLLEFAHRDQRITGAAITGSAAASSEDQLREDQWSDVDLAFGVHTAANVPIVLSDWTAHMYDRHGALHHLDMLFGAWTYRVFLLSNTLQVDLAFVAETEFRALAPTFRLMFGKANEPRHAPPPEPTAIIGLAWLYALHARTCIARRKLWQAEYMISGVRDHALALASIRHGLSSVHGRGIDLLPREVTAPFEDSLVRQLDTDELARAFRVAMHGLVQEISKADQELAQQLHEVLTALSE